MPPSLIPWKLSWGYFWKRYWIDNKLKANDLNNPEQWFPNFSVHQNHLKDLLKQGAHLQSFSRAGVKEHVFLFFFFFDKHVLLTSGQVMMLHLGITPGEHWPRTLGFLLPLSPYPSPFFLKNRPNHQKSQFITWVCFVHFFCTDFVAFSFGQAVLDHVPQFQAINITRELTAGEGKEMTLE